MKRETKTTKSAPKKQPAELPLPEIELPDAHPDRRWLWCVGALAGAGLFVAGMLVALQRVIPGWEERIFRFVNNWPEGLRTFFLVGTIAPESVWIAVAAVVVTFFVKLYRLSWQLAAGTLIGYALGFMAKELIARPRPIAFFHDAHVRVSETGMGFPSGHTMIITIVVLTLFPYLPRGWRYGVLALIPLMGLSRVYLGVHAPLDVVGGFALGLVVVSCMRFLPAKLREYCRLD